MKSFFTMALTLCMCVVFAGCPDSVKCDKIKPVSDAAAMSFAKALDCKGTDAMKTDFIKFCADKGLCKQSLEGLEGPIASLVCPVLVKYVVDFGTGKLPATWQCSGEPAEQALLAACMMIPY